MAFKMKYNKGKGFPFKNSPLKTHEGPDKPHKQSKLDKLLE